MSRMASRLPNSNGPGRPKRNVTLMTVSIDAEIISEADINVAALIDHSGALRRAINGIDE